MDVLGGLLMGCGTFGRWGDVEDVLARLLLGWRTLGPWEGVEREEVAIFFVLNLCLILFDSMDNQNSDILIFAKKTYAH